MPAPSAIQPPPHDVTSAAEPPWRWLIILRGGCAHASAAEPPWRWLDVLRGWSEPSGAAERREETTSDLGVAALPVGVAELALVELAAGVAWELRGEVDGLGALVAGQVLDAEGEDLVAQ